VRTDHPRLWMAVPIGCLLVAPLSSRALAVQTADPAIAFVASHSVTVGKGHNAVTTFYYDLTVMDADGSDPTILLTETSNSSWFPALDEPAWSPDLDGNPANGFQGCLAVIIYEASGGNLYVMDVAVTGGIPQVSNLRKVVDATADPSVGDRVFDPEWSPDLDPLTPGYQGRIAFTGSTDEGHTGSVNLIAMVWDGATAQLVGPPSSSFVLYDGHPTGEVPFDTTWSPDGARIAVRAGPRILVLDAASGWVSSELSFSSYSWWPTDLQWSRTSSRVAFGLAQKLYTIDVDAGIASLVAVSVPSSAGSRHPTWSPDDSSLAFANIAAVKKPEKSTWNIVRMDLSTGVLTVLVNGLAIGRDLRLSTPDWRRF
jgi:hypothetical protein